MKYQYLLHQTAYSLLKIQPDFLKRLLTTSFVAAKKVPLKKGNGPFSMILYVTNRCNAGCSHCFYWREVENIGEKNLKLSDLKRLAKSLPVPLSTLSITGGEPFMRKDLPRVCLLFGKINRPKKVNIVTNGFFTQAILDSAKEILKKANFALNIQVSIDGLKETHDKIRRISVFDKAVKTVEELEKLSQKYKNFQLTVQTTVSSQNLSEISKLGKLLSSRFPQVHHGFQFVRSPSRDVYQINKEILSGFDPRSDKPLLSVKELEIALSKINRFSNRRHSLLSKYITVMNREIVKMKKDQSPFVKCLAGKHDAVVWPSGDVSLCEFTKPFASLEDYAFDFYKLWNSEAAKATRKKTEKCYCTHTCYLMRAMAYDPKALMEVLR